MNRSEKIAVVSSLSDRLQQSRLVVLVNQDGMTVEELTSLRSAAKIKGVVVQLAKNTLSRLACSEGVHKGIQGFFKGQTVMVCSEDPVAAIKVLNDFKSKKLTWVVGSLEGAVLNSAQLTELAKLPSLDVLRAQILQMVLMSAQRLVAVVAAPGQALVRVLEARRSTLEN